MALTADELVSLSNASLDHYIRSQPESQILQDRPLYNDMMANAKSFNGAEEYIRKNVKGVYSSSMVGYSHDDEVSYVNPANIKQAKAKWYEVASGIKVFYTELKANGIHVLDSAMGKNVSASADELQRISNIFDDKNEDLMEGSERSLAEMFWRDGTQDAKALPGILSFIVNSPSTGTRFGIDAAANSWWRNRANLAIDASTASNNNLVNELQQEVRQLRRYARKPKHKVYAGSDWMEAFEKELRAKGNYTLTGWAKSGRIDASIADLEFKGIEIVYEPLLDDLSRAKYGYILDLNAIRLWKMDSEWMVRHNPARPAEQYVLYRGITCTGAIMATQLNSSCVTSIA